jgi:hypothetical protein
VSGDTFLFVVLVLLPILLVWFVYLFFRKHKLHRSGGLFRLSVGNLLVVALLASVALLAGEIRYRYFYDTTDGVNMTKTSRRWYDRHWQLNANNFRDTVDYDSVPKGGKRRVTFLGDSFTAAQGVDVEARFANRYRALRPEVEVHALALCGWDTIDQLDFVQNQLAAGGYRFDLVVLCYCLNDLADLIPDLDRMFHRYQRTRPNYFCRHSYFLNTLYWRLLLAGDSFAQDYTQVIMEHYSGPTWEKQKARLKTLRDFIHARGGKLVVITFPFLDYGESYPCEHVHQQLGEFWEEQKVPHLDTLSLFRAKPAKEWIVNAYDRHPNEQAHALVGEALMDFLKDK